MTTPEYIIFWKPNPGQQVATTVNDKNEPLTYSDEYLVENNVELLHDTEQVEQVLSVADGVRYAVSTDIARDVLGWDV